MHGSSDAPASSESDQLTLLQSILDALTLLDATPGRNLLDLKSAASLPSLLTQCEAMAGEFAEPRVEPVRIIHHFACTGGTLISKCLAALPNTLLLSEIDPLSRAVLRSYETRFRPTDLIFALRRSHREVSEETLADLFMAGLVRLHAVASAEGRRVVIRDHSHSHFCLDIDPHGRPTLRAIVARDLPVRSVVTVRHPLDSFLSMLAHKWIEFTPPTLEEYSRRYLTFLSFHAGLPIYAYETFVADPSGVLGQICTDLALPFHPMVLDAIGAISLSGDSGRKGDEIGSRSRRNVPEDVVAMAQASPAYDALCAELGYSASAEL